MKKTALLVLLVLSPLTAIADIHKCIVNGRTSYQDTPCTQGAAPRSNTGTLSTLPIPAPATRSTAPRVSQPAQQYQRPNYNSRSNSYQSSTERRNAEVSTRNRGRLMPGMPHGRAYATYGRPHSISKVMRNNQMCERLYWYNPPFNPGRHEVVICNQEIYSYNGPYR